MQTRETGKCVKRGGLRSCNHGIVARGMDLFDLGPLPPWEAGRSSQTRIYSYSSVSRPRAGATRPSPWPLLGSTKVCAPQIGRTRQ